MSEHQSKADDSVGAAWLKTSKNGNEYLTLVIETGGVKNNFVAFRNARKTADNQPDYKIFISKPREK